MKRGLFGYLFTHFPPRRFRTAASEPRLFNVHRLQGGKRALYRIFGMRASLHQIKKRERKIQEKNVRPESIIIPSPRSAAVLLRFPHYIITGKRTWLSKWYGRILLIETNDQHRTLEMQMSTRHGPMSFNRQRYSFWQQQPREKLQHWSYLYHLSACSRVSLSSFFSILSLGWPLKKDRD